MHWDKRKQWTLSKVNRKKNTSRYIAEYYEETLLKLLICIFYHNKSKDSGLEKTPIIYLESILE